MKNGTSLRVGIVGSGFGGAVHAPAYALHPRFEVVAIASPTNAERVARERKISHAFGSVEEMLAGVELDVVSVASPPFDHHRSVLAALAAGKHVLCEKPFSANVAQAEEMVPRASVRAPPARLRSSSATCRRSSRSKSSSTTFTWARCGRSRSRA